MIGSRRRFGRFLPLLVSALLLGGLMALPLCGQTPAGAPAGYADPTFCGEPPASAPSAGVSAANVTAATGTPPAVAATPLPQAPVGQETVIFATTTSVQDTGLLDLLQPLFEKATGFKLKPIAVGTGQALALGARGEADVLLVHAAAAEKAWMAAGHGKSRRLVMYNDFVLLGPVGDPAAVKGRADVAAAFAGLASAGALFVSRGDESGTHMRERELWAAAGVVPAGKPWYQEAGQGMGATLNIANEKRAYVLSDRSTFVSRQGQLQLEVVGEGDPRLLNLYHVMTVDAGKFPKVNALGGQAFADFLLRPEVQALLREFGREKLGRALFVPAAGRDEAELAR